MVSLKTPVGDLKMIGPSYLTRLKNLSISTVEDLLFHIPSRYENYSLITKISSLQEGKTVTVAGKIAKFANIYTKTGKNIQKVALSDDTGTIAAIFFNQAYLANIFKIGTSVTFAGTVKMYIKNLSFVAPQYEIIKSEGVLLHTGRIVPVYPETEGITSKWIRTRIATLLNKLNINIEEFLPIEIIDKYNLVTLKKAVNDIHFPKNIEVAEMARKRLSFNELIIIQLASAIRKREIEMKKTQAKMNLDKYRAHIDSFVRNLPFKLTSAQITSVKEILADLDREKPMNRLLEGDVGSGKTIVALIASYFCYLNGYQTIIMAPTEILAKQHYQTFSDLLSSYKLKISLITSKQSSENLKTENLSPNIIIGTHALLYRRYEDNKVALVVIDEQQRFGVEQRKTLLSKSNNNPHLLTMTATPIPRTIALTLYSDLDLSVIDQMPEGRLQIKTFVVPPEKRQSAYDWIKKEILDSGYTKQVFIICPLVEQSETLITVKSAKKEFERLRMEIFPDFKLGLIHGKLKSAEKDKMINKFKEGKVNILVATPVVEVGIDIPQATIIMIEEGDRFGLAQLHQLRGRVGRANVQSYCLLFTQSDKKETLERLKILEKYSVGIKLAEYDLAKRGPGQFFGLRQHGSLGLKYTDISDLPAFITTKKAALEILEKYPTLSLFPLLQEKLLPYTIQTVSPD